jgi:LuxR family maltose regulon positive regulatory protein
MPTSPDNQVRYLVQTKLHPPHISREIVVRPRLLHLFDLEAELTLVIAAAGYGKTTLLCNWLSACYGPAAWLTLDADDDSLVQFLTYLTLAMRRLFPNFGDALLEQLAAPSLPPMSVLAGMVHRAFESIDQPCVLVLDDYHVLRRPEIHTLLTELLRNLPAPLRLVIAARHDPPLPLNSLRAQGRVVEIRSSDLRFTEAETHQLLQGSLPAPLDKRDLNELVRSTEGWVVSLQLARLYLRQEQGFASLHRALDVGARRAMDFLAEEVFAQLPKETQTFLMQTAVLEHLCAGACAAICDAGVSVAQAQSLLFWLAANSVFTVALDEEEDCFQYHALFRQFALQQLRQHATPAQIAELHRRASRWCLDEGLATEGIRHSLAAGDVAEAVQIFTRLRRQLINVEDWSRLAQTLRIFPPDLIAQQPELLLAQIWEARSRNDHARAGALLQQASELIATLPGEVAPQTPAHNFSRLTGEIDALLSFFYYWRGEPATAIEHGHRALHLLPPEDSYMRSFALLMLTSSCQASGDLAGAYALLDAYANAVYPTEPIAQVHVPICRGFLQSIAGDLRALNESIGQLLASGKVNTTNTDIYGLAHYFQATVHYYQNDLPAVALVLAEPLARRYQLVPRHVIQCAHLLALSYQALQRPDDANQVAASVLHYAEELGTLELMPLVAGLQAELALRQGRLEDAGLLLRDLAPLTPAPMPFAYVPHMTLARFYLHQNSAESLQAAGALLGQLQEMAEAQHNGRALLQTLALKTVYWQVSGAQTAALETLAHALRLAEPGGYVRIFADLGSDINGLLEELQQQGVTPLLIAAIRAALAAEQPSHLDVAPRRVPLEPAAPAVDDRLIVLLTFREQEVLRLLGERLTNQEIAQLLCISTETVKRHSISIFRKLQVKNRRAASLLARQLPPA